MTFRYNRTPTGELPGNSMVAQTEAALSALSGEATEAKEAAQAAETAAEDASSAASAAAAAEHAAQSASVAQQALTIASRAEATAGQASTTATAAATAAQAAQTEAENAASDAEDAASAAADAASAAGSSASSATAAQTAAESAQTSADQSAGLATQAQTAAAQSAQAAEGAAALIASAIPAIGSYMYVAGDDVPEHYLLCNGAAVSREDYAYLYAVIGDKYGAGDGSTTFNLPNLIDKFLEGSSVSGTEIAAGLPNISGSINNGGLGSTALLKADGVYTAVSGALYVGGLTATQPPAGSGTTDNAHVLSIDASRSNAIYGGSSTVQPPALTALPCIRYE